MSVGAGSTAQPAGDIVLCDVARPPTTSSNGFGTTASTATGIAIEAVEVDVSDAAAAAEASSPGAGGNALVREELEARSRRDRTHAAATIAAIGILLDSPILVLGAMVVGSDYGLPVALCVAS